MSSTTSTTDHAPTRAEPRSGHTGPEGTTSPGRETAEEAVGPELGRGDQVGRYIIVDAIGHGGMGQVFSAYDPELDRKVALKLLRIKSSRSDRRAGARLVREAQAMAKLAHPNVVTVFDAGTHGDRVFVAMEHIGGPTLKAWLGDRERSWTEVLDVMREAGRGLAAAHSVGLVHRDFKLDNVMLGDDGRARVLDFGLARRYDDDALDEDPALESGADPTDFERSGSGPDMALTATGMVMGTPRFMAPEQFFGGRIDARTDQFSFCVALFRGLFGVAPFPGDDFRSLGYSVLHGDIVTPPRVPGLPRAVRQAIERGLSVSREDRFESMEPLLQVLDRARASRRRRVGVGVLVGALVVGAGTLGWSSREAPTPCVDAADAMDEVWDRARADAVREAFAITDAAFAADASERVTQRLDDYAEQWRGQRLDACEATMVRRSQSEAMMDRRVACLEGRRQRLAALVEVLVTADTEVVQRSVDAAGRLPLLTRCDDVEALLADVPPPEDPRVAAQVKALQYELARADAARLAGRYADGIELATPLIERARALGHTATVAEVARVLGMLHERAGRAEPAFARLDEALWAAIASGHDREHALTLLSLVTLEADRHPDGIALRHARQAEAVLERLGRPPELMPVLHASIGTAHARRREWDEAEEAYREAIALAAERTDTREVELLALGNLASILSRRGHYEEALRINERSRGLGVEHLGPRHPTVAKLLHNYANTLLEAGQPTNAIEMMKESQAVMEASVGTEHPEVARIIGNIGFAYRMQHDWPSTLEYARRALELKRKILGPDHPSVAVSANNVGEALSQLGRASEAVVQYEDALRIFGDAPERIYVQGGYAMALMAAGRTEEGTATAEAVLAGIESTEASELDRGRLLFEVARSLAQAPGQQRRAVTLADRARASIAASEGNMEVELRELDEWLDEHRD